MGFVLFYYSPAVLRRGLTWQPSGLDLRLHVPLTGPGGFLSFLPGANVFLCMLSQRVYWSLWAKHCWGAHTLAPGASSPPGELFHSSERKLPFWLSAAGSPAEVQGVTPCGLRLQDFLCSCLDFFIFLPYGFVNKTLSLGQNILWVSLQPKENDFSKVWRKIVQIRECFRLKLSGVFQVCKEHTHSLCTYSFVPKLGVGWLWIGCTGPSKAQLLRHFLEQTSCSLYGGQILPVRISLHVLQFSYSILYAKTHHRVEDIPSH